MAWPWLSLASLLFFLVMLSLALSIWYLASSTCFLPLATLSLGCCWAWGGCLSLFSLACCWPSLGAFFAWPWSGLFWPGFASACLLSPSGGLPPDLLSPGLESPLL